MTRHFGAFCQENGILAGLLSRIADNTTCVFDFGWFDFNQAGFREHESAKSALSEEFPVTCSVPA